MLCQWLKQLMVMSYLHCLQMFRQLPSHFKPKLFLCTVASKFLSYFPLGKQSAQKAVSKLVTQ